MTQKQKRKTFIVRCDKSLFDGIKIVTHEMETNRNLFVTTLLSEWVRIAGAGNGAFRGVIVELSSETADQLAIMSGARDIERSRLVAEYVERGLTEDIKEGAL
jgi:hypothetical protein